MWNRSAGKATDLVTAGATGAGTLDDAVDGADVALTSPSDDAAVVEVVRRTLS